MTSGAKVHKDVVTFFEKMKKSESSNERVRLATFKFEDCYIKLGKVCKQKDLDEKQLDGFEYFKTLLTPKKCCYLVYDCHFATEESSNKQELVFVMWCPEDAPAKEKMNHAASRQTFVKTLKGFKHDLQINDFSDCSDRSKFAKELGKPVTHIEGVAVSV